MRKPHFVELDSFGQAHPVAKPPDLTLHVGVHPDSHNVFMLLLLQITEQFLVIKTAVRPYKTYLFAFECLVKSLLHKEFAAAAVGGIAGPQPCVGYHSGLADKGHQGRSEEHTSELQSRPH